MYTNVGILVVPLHQAPSAECILILIYPGGKIACSFLQVMFSNGLLWEIPLTMFYFFKDYFQKGSGTWLAIKPIECSSVASCI
jgi:hypothetical protein